MFAQQARQLLHEGNKAYKEGNYEQAESLYRSALEKDKGDFIGNYNLGTALYRQGRYEEAVEQFVASYPLQEDPKLIAKACHNVGNSWLQQRKWKEAIDAYKEALKNNPNDDKSRYNLAYAQAMLKKDPPQQQQQKDQNQDDENQDKKDGQQDKKDQNKNQGEDNEEKKDDDQQEQQSSGEDQQEKQKKQKQHQLSKAEAKRLLDASNNAERKTQAKVMLGKKQKKEKGKIEKDW